MKILYVMVMSVLLGSAGIWTAGRAMNGEVPPEVVNFHHWTVKYHWASPDIRRITVLLDEGVDITDASCASVLHMLDRLSSLAPDYEIFLISSNGDSWVPVRNNPIDREGVLEMLADEKDYAQNAYEFIKKLEREDPDDRFIEYQRLWRKRSETRSAK